MIFGQELTSRTKNVSSSKICTILENKLVQKLKLENNVFTKYGLLNKYALSNEKKISFFVDS
jgi:hypothetical protein